MIEKLFGWMKLDNEQNIEEYSKNNSEVYTTEKADNTISEFRINTDTTHYMDTSIEKSQAETIKECIPQKHNTHDETIQNEISPNKPIPVEIALDKINPDDILHDKFEQNRTIQDNIIQAETDEQTLYVSQRKIIVGVHIFFISVAREVVQEQCIKKIPLMREFQLQKSTLDEIIEQLHEANIIGQYNQILMTPQELEKFLDIYEPTLFNCEHTIFDKEIFLCMGEIIYENGVDSVYDSMDEDEVLDYLNIMEKLRIIEYNPEINEYDIISSKEDFLNICECIPRSFTNEDYAAQEQDYQGKDFDNMTGLEFERYCGYILQQNSFTEIKITQASGDHGIDILAEKDGNHYAFQCKCYSDNVGNDAIQQAHTGKSLYHTDIAVVITNRYFTQQAKGEAKQLGVKLWDRDKLLELVNNIKQ